MIFPNVKVQPHWLETLEAAVEVLPNCRWVCSAISFDNKPETIGHEIREAIVHAIMPFNIVDSWLIHETGIVLTKREPKEYRTAWLNHMIEQCRSMQPKEPT